MVMTNHGEVIAAGRVDDLIAQYGRTRIEVTMDETVQVVDGEDVPAAIAQVTAGGGRVDAVDVITPSLETVFRTSRHAQHGCRGVLTIGDALLAHTATIRIDNMAVIDHRSVDFPLSWHLRPPQQAARCAR